MGKKTILLRKTNNKKLFFRENWPNSQKRGPSTPCIFFVQLFVIESYSRQKMVKITKFGGYTINYLEDIVKKQILRSDRRHK